jgi:hypothetical protein
MGTDNEIDRRSLIVRTAGAISAAGAITGAEAAPASAQANQPIPPGFDDQQPLIQFGTSHSIKSWTSICGRMRRSLQTPLLASGTGSIAIS